MASVFYGKPKIIMLTPSCNHVGIADGLNIPLSLGHANPSSSIVMGAGILVGSTYDGGTRTFSAPAGRDIVVCGAGATADMPSLRRRLARRIRRASAYLFIIVL